MQGTKVNYLVMSKNKADCRRTVVNIYNQLYPNDLKTVYVLYQEPFPEHFICELDIEVIQINVEGITGNDWWFKKILAYCGHVRNKDSVTFITDEDDVYEPCFTKLVLTALTDDLDVVYNHDMIIVEGERIYRQKWSNAISTTGI